MKDFTQQCAAQAHCWVLFVTMAVVFSENMLSQMEIFLDTMMVRNILLILIYAQNAHGKGVMVCKVKLAFKWASFGGLV
ncbi:hypothetical protein [Emticicia sp. 17c]|uniref:hypothetical protein n=1 Tax=Emticicia sp. 17c TaxID=3127704 RepID=UPI00301C053D